jgi:hypothetical protein
VVGRRRARLHEVRGGGEGGSHTPHRVNTMMKLFHLCLSIQNMESP